jgi:hypothetical protein
MVGFGMLLVMLYYMLKVPAQATLINIVVAFIVSKFLSIAVSNFLAWHIAGSTQ